MLPRLPRLEHHGIVRRTGCNLIGSILQVEELLNLGVLLNRQTALPVEKFAYYRLMNAQMFSQRGARATPHLIELLR
jgi:hypothetical protein